MSGSNYDNNIQFFFVKKKLPKEIDLRVYI